MRHKKEKPGMVRKERFELSHPYEYYALNVARLPFRHLRVKQRRGLPKMVRKEGLEPSRREAQPPQDCVSTSSTTPACWLYNLLLKYGGRDWTRTSGLILIRNVL